MASYAPGGASSTAPCLLAAQPWRGSRQGGLHCTLCWRLLAQPMAVSAVWPLASRRVGGSHIVCSLIRCCTRLLVAPGCSTARVPCSSVVLQVRLLCRWDHAYCHAHTHAPLVICCRYFAALTSSSRRARKLDLPYFHLLKPENIKLWLSLRAAVQRRGNKRATEAVVTVSFAVALALVRCECKRAAWGM